MEDFFYEDIFCTDISDLMDALDLDDIDIEDLEEDWTCRIQLTTLEPMIQLNAHDLAEMIYNANEDRYSMDNIDEDDKKIIRAINESINFEKLNASIPQYYYPNNNWDIITKQDLINYME